MEGASFAVLDEDVEGEVFLVDLVVEVADDVDVVHLDEGVDLVDDPLFLFGGDGGEGDLLGDGLGFGGGEGL